MSTTLAGTWLNESLLAKRDDGRPFNAFGANTKGILFIDAGGRFVVVLLGDFRRKFASGNRLQGTPEEYIAMGRGSNAYYGTYSVDEARGVLTMHVEASCFSNWDETYQTRRFTLHRDQLTLFSPETAAGGTAVVVWRRAGPQ